MFKKMLATAFLVALAGSFTMAQSGKVELKVGIDSALVRVITVEEPLVNYKRNGVIEGTTADIVKKIMADLQINSEIIVMPGEQAIKYFNENPNVVIFTVGYTPERVNLGWQYIRPVITTKLALFKKKGSICKVKDLNDLKSQKLTCGTMRGDWREKYFSDQGVQVTTAADYEESFKMLEANKIDLAISSDIDMRALLVKMGRPLDSVERVIDLQETQSYIALSKGTSKEIVDQWKNAFDSLKQTNFFQTIAEKHSKIIGYPLGYLPEKGFYAK